MRIESKRAVSSTATTDALPFIITMVAKLGCDRATFVSCGKRIAGTIQIEHFLLVWLPLQFG